MDGNRRYAKKLLLEPWKGHVFGKEKVFDLLDYSKELGIKELTFYTLSIENINNRPKNELDFLYTLFRKVFKELDNENIHKNKIKINFIGNISLLPDDIQEICKNLMNKTKDYSDLIVNFAIAYGGRQEIMDAIKNILKNNIQIKDINEETIKNYLYLPSEPEIIIRTGGEKRTSNFLPWQSIYSEWFFLDKFWPEFNKEDLLDCIKEYHLRKRNFGK